MKKLLKLKDKIFYAAASVSMLVLNLGMIVCAYWYFFDTDAPVRIDYSHPHFTDREVNNRADAQRFSIESARADTVVFRYVEYCVLRSVPGEIEKAWIDGIVYQVPPTTTLAQVGCYRRNFAEIAPPIPGHLVKFYAKGRYKNNPLRVATLQAAPMSLLVTR